MESTAIGPQSLLSRRSNMVTEIVLVRAVNSRIVAESSRIEPMKMKIQVAITPLRMSGVVMSNSARSRVRAKNAARVLRAPDAPRCSELRDLLVADRKLLREVGEEDDRQRSIQHERRLRVGSGTGRRRARCRESRPVPSRETPS